MSKKRNNLTKFASILLIIFLAGTLAVGSALAPVLVSAANSSTTATTIPVTGVTLAPLAATINVGATQQLTASVIPADATDKTVSWSSNNPAVATVSDTGLVTAVGGGGAVITVTTADGNFTANSTITVVVPVTRVTLAPAAFNLVAANATRQLTATVLPANATNRAVTWSSDNTAVATVNDTGLVTAVSVGTAIITVTTLDGGFTARTTVTVQLPGEIRRGSFIHGAGLYDRTFVYYLPSSFDVNESVPLLLSFHGMGGTGTGMKTTTGFASVAEEEGFIAVFPYSTRFLDPAALTMHGVDRRPYLPQILRPPAAPMMSVIGVQWDSGIGSSLAHFPEYGVDDIGFVSRLIDHFAATYNIEQRRVYATGFSNGAMFAYNLAVNLSDRIAAVGGVAAVMTLPLLDLEPRQPSSVIVVMGDADTVVPFAGGVSPAGSFKEQPSFASFVETGSYFVGKNRITAAPVVTELEGNVVRSIYSGGRYGTEVILYQVRGGAHVWFNLPAINSRVLWDHLEDYTLAVPATGVTLAPPAATINVGATQQLTASVIPADATDNTVSWSSSNPAVATVSDTGLVTAVGVGSAVITVTTADGNFTATSTITVVVPVTGVTLSPAAFILAATNPTQQLTATVSPANATNRAVTWSSDNTAVATVNATGLVTAVSVGTATITVTTVDGSFTARTTVTVLPGELRRNSFFHGPHNRTFVYYLPSSYDGTESVPMLLSFHGMGGTGTGMKTTTGFASVAEEEGFIAVFPYSTRFLDPADLTRFGVDRRPYLPQVLAPPAPPLMALIGVQWDAGIGTSLAHFPEYQVDDIGFVSRLIDRFTQTYNIEQRRVYATGFSNGAMFAYNLAINLSDKIAAVGGKGANMTLPLLDLEPKQPISIIAVMGDADAIVPFIGGVSPFGSYKWRPSFSSFAETGAYWVEKNSIATAPVVTELEGNVERSVYSGGRYGTEVILYRVRGGAHVWFNLPAINSRVLWDHLEAYTLAIPATGVTLAPPAATINVGATQQLTASVIPADATDKTVSWSSSNPAVATVSSNGLVTAVGVGSAVITVTTADGNFTATSTITVTYIFGGIRPPVNADGSSVFNPGRTVPVKFQLFDHSGNLMTNAIARMFLTHSAAGSAEREAVSSSAANIGNHFRFSDGQYIFNWSTRGLQRGNWQIRILLDDGTSHFVSVVLR